MQRRLERVRLSDVDLEDTTYCARLELRARGLSRLYRLWIRDCGKERC